MIRTNYLCDHSAALGSLKGNSMGGGAHEAQRVRLWRVLVNEPDRSVRFHESLFWISEGNGEGERHIDLQDLINSGNQGGETIQ